MFRALAKLSRTKLSTIARVGNSNLGGHCRRMSSSLPNSPIFKALATHNADSTAVIHSDSQRAFTYGELVNDIASARTGLLENSKDWKAGQRVAILVENGYDYVVSLFSVLACDLVAIPLSSSFPTSELQYILDNSEASAILSSEKFRSKADEAVAAGLKHQPEVITVPKLLKGASGQSQIKWHDGHAGEGGMMLYTSGTTNRPKGVLLSEAVLTAQARSLLEAWNYMPQDRLLHVLPLHHIHGTVNGLITPLIAGSAIEFMFPFNPTAVWQRFAAPFLPLTSDKPKEKITFFTAVPTIYNRLLSIHSTLEPEVRTASRTAITPENLRLNISGSAALPVTTKAAWSELSSGNVLLERYGMTEVGMALSCGLAKGDRVDGSVGWPLPSVEVRLVDAETGQAIPGEVEGEGATTTTTTNNNGASPEERSGEIQLRGPTVFKEYWRNPEATAAEFVESSDGQGRWFKTGDIAVRRHVEGAGQSKDQAWAQGPMYFILGRKSVDIIKTGGEKVSALEIERELLALPQIAEVAVVGIPSEQWGQKVAAIVVLHPDQANTGRAGKQWGLMDMRRALKDRLVNYKVPQELKVLEGGLPRNAMGKVNKKALLKEVFLDQAS